MGIRVRMTLWYTGVTVGIVSLFGLLICVYLGSSLADGVDRELTEAAGRVRDDLLSKNDPNAAVHNGLVALPAGDLSWPAPYLQVVRGGDSVVVRSHNLGSQRLPLDMDILAANMQGEAAFKTMVLDDGGRLRVYSEPIVLSQRVIGAVQTGLPLREVDGALQRAWAGAAAGSLLSLAAAGGVGWWLSWLAVRPIDRITRAGSRIVGARDSGERLPLPKRDDEVGRLAGAFNALLDWLAQVIDAQQRLGADVSHELRTPLTTIRGNVDLLRRGAADDPRERAVALDAIDVEVNRMSRLVSDLVVLAQADAGMQLEKQPVELDTLLLHVYRQAQTVAAFSFPGSERVAVRLGHEDQAVVRGDPDRLRQLLLNLIDNALKYTPRGGSVTLSLYREAGWVRVLVQDTGVGIAAHDLPHVFDRFYRAPQQPPCEDRGLPHGRKGVGLGLSIARWIAEAHDGRLEVQSEVGRGTTFTLWLPDCGGADIGAQRDFSETCSPRSAR